MTDTIRVTGKIHTNIVLNNLYRIYFEQAIFNITNIRIDVANLKVKSLRNY